MMPHDLLVEFGGVYTLFGSELVLFVRALLLFMMPHDLLVEFGGVYTLFGSELVMFVPYDC
jgi:hypothetical protein